MCFSTLLSKDLTLFNDFCSARRSGNSGVQVIHTTLFLEGKDQVWHVVNGASAYLSALAYPSKAVAVLGPAATFAVDLPFAF